ncbi:MAG TPA: hypothetical protein VGY57_08180, partial [Vicinamibacterales bacterium]|nr:hypothetical protein [Vicinamibacterales bacterium]
MKKIALAIVILCTGGAALAALSRSGAADDLTGRWVARVPNNDGTFRETVFVLNQQGSTLTGSVITPTSEQPFVDGAVTGDAFSFASAPATNPRRTIYRGTRTGDKIAITIVRPGRPDQSLNADRGPDGAGRLPARIAPPALHPVADNGLARTPPMGWNSWNHFRGGFDDATV